MKKQRKRKKGKLSRKSVQGDKLEGFSSRKKKKDEEEREGKSKTGR